MSSLLPTLPLRLSFLDSLHQPITYTLPPVPFYQPRYITILTSSSHTHFLSTSTIYPCFFPTPHYQDLPPVPLGEWNPESIVLYYFMLFYSWSSHSYVTNIEYIP